MSERELERAGVLAGVKGKQLRVADAAVLMGVSYRQAKRLWKRYRERGAAGLKHESAGRRSNHAHDEKFRQRVLGLVREKYSGRIGERFGRVLGLYRERYFDLNVRHFHEKLASAHEIRLSYSWVKGILQGAGLVARGRKRGCTCYEH
jgi:transposase